MSTVTTKGGIRGEFDSIREVRLDDPWNWLSAGWQDVWRAPRISLAYGCAIALASFLLTACLFSLQMTSLVLVLAAGFMLIGPMLAVGLYETSRRLETGEPLSFRNVLFVTTHSPAQLAFLGVLLMLAMLAWIRVATLLFALFFSGGHFPPLTEFVPTLLFSWHGLGLLMIGTAVGGVIAFLVYAASVISVPLLMVQDRDAISAVLMSLHAVVRNPGPMLLWAWLVALLTACGIATGFIGLIVIFPLLGHATWHAFRALVKT